MSYRFRLATPMRVAVARAGALRMELSQAMAAHRESLEALDVARRGLEEAHADVFAATRDTADPYELAAFVGLLRGRRSWLERCIAEEASRRRLVDEMTARLAAERKRVGTLEQMRARDRRDWLRSVEKGEQIKVDDAFGARALRAARRDRRRTQ